MQTFFVIAGWILLFWFGLAFLVTGLFNTLFGDQLKGKSISVESVVLISLGAGMLYGALKYMPFTIVLGVAG